jgi:hypothetical protein
MLGGSLPANIFEFCGVCLVNRDFLKEKTPRHYAAANCISSQIDLCILHIQESLHYGKSRVVLALI